MKKTLLLLVAAVINVISLSAQSTFDITAVASWQELPSSPAMWKSGTNYKVTTTSTITGQANLPVNSMICIAGNGNLNLNKATLNCASGTAIFVVGGKLSLNTSTITMGDGCTFTEGELGMINMQNSTIGLGQQSLLTINGKAINGTGSTITGGSTALTAPIRKIFSTGINVTGKWILDRAYPQWFKDEKETNWAIAINKAIAMKGTGEVFLPRGKYNISSSIYVSFGIKLMGEAGRDKTGPNTDCTEIIPSTGKTSFNGGYMMLVNVKHEDSAGKEIEVTPENATWEYHYPNVGTALQNLTFTCSGNIRYKTILVAGGIFVDHITWNGCLQALASAYKTYDDHRIITNCSFYPATGVKMQSRPTLYAFDLNSLGDAMVFTGNAVHMCDNYTRALRVSQSFGGVISGNVLNGDVLIDHCKGISYSSNHSEYGHTVTIQSSTVVNNANFYEKGPNPSVIITSTSDKENSSVTINGDQFVYYNGMRGRNNGSRENADDAAARLRNISEIDIAIDQQSQLALNNAYRYDAPLNSGIGTQYVYGINVANINSKKGFESIKSFNRYSHTLSKNGTINKSNKVNKPQLKLSPDNSRIYLYGKATVTWLGESGDYTYSFEIVDDNGRTTNQGKSLSSYVDKKPVIHLDKGGKGPLLNVTDIGEAGNNLFVKLERRGTDGIKRVEVPLAGTKHIYDNGISVAGYLWK